MNGLILVLPKFFGSLIQFRNVIKFSILNADQGPKNYEERLLSFSEYVAHSLGCKCIFYSEEIDQGLPVLMCKAEGVTTAIARAAWGEA